jgi:hypothetical protein
MNGLFYRQGAKNAKVAKKEKKMNCFSFAPFAFLASWR